MGIEENKRIIREFMDATSAGDVERIVAAYAEDGVLQTMGSTLISGTYTREQVAAAAGHIFQIFPEGIAFTIHNMTAEGDRVAVEAESLGRHVSGKVYNNKYHFLAQLRDGKITRWAEYCDTELITDILCGGQRPQPAA